MKLEHQDRPFRRPQALDCEPLTDPRPLAVGDHLIEARVRMTRIVMAESPPFDPRLLRQLQRLDIRSNRPT